MIELLRMDLRRMVKSGVLWILPLVILCLITATYLLTSLLTDPETLRAMASRGAEVTAADYAEGQRLAGYSTLRFLQENLFGGGLWLVAMGFGAGLFAVADFTGGYAKNIFSLLPRRGSYVAARAVSLLVLTAVTLGAIFLFALATKPLTLFSDWGGTPLDWLQMYLEGCVCGWAFSMLLQFCATLFRREGWLVVAIFVLGCGALPMLLGLLFAGAPFNPMVFTIFACAQSITTTFHPLTMGYLLGVCLLWGAVYAGLTTLLLEKRDIV